MGWLRPVYQPPTLWDRLRGYAHHDCEYCQEAARYPRLRVLHPPDYPPPWANIEAVDEARIAERLRRYVG